MKNFHYLQLGLAVILSSVGVKMLIEGFFEIPILVSLGVIVVVLTVSILASLWWPPSEAQRIEGY